MSNYPSNMLREFVRYYGRLAGEAIPGMFSHLEPKKHYSRGDLEDLEFYIGLFLNDYRGVAMRDEMESLLKEITGKGLERKMEE